VENGFYHIYNRGIEKRNIFLDEQDFQVFLSYLKIYLTPKDIPYLNSVFELEKSTPKEKDKALKLLALKNYSDKIDLLCYALMPNHFHFLVQQKTVDGINHFIKSLGTKYSMYFNKKYHRVGTIFQGVYKAVLVDDENYLLYLLYLSRYIHNNPPKGSNYPTSLPEYLGIRSSAWIKPELILTYFSKANPQNSYSSFLSEKTLEESISKYMIEADDVY